jgi:hypothetical protein
VYKTNVQKLIDWWGLSSGWQTGWIAGIELWMLKLFGDEMDFLFGGMEPFFCSIIYGNNHPN